jgi:hypothetical protein
MLQLVVRKVKPDQESRLRQWLAELSRRREEARATMTREGVRHEQAYLLTTAEGPVLIYAMEAADHEQARRAFKDSTDPIDIEHKRVMEEVLGANARPELLYDCILSVSSP